MAIKFSDIEFAFDFVSMGQMHMHSAYICRKTGEVFYTSEMGDSDELPEDIYENEQYVKIPHKNDLDLGKALVIDFTSDHMPDNIEDVYSIFRKKGAYSKFKNLLEAKDLLEEWYSFEEKRQNEALRDWCKEKKIETTG
ncbi:MAG: UPF0158 family protein [Candidatus Electrothrix aestuarii]|uniref:UPF0158 family protein n=1 Tax=Candidatus Electrothrix aestuarii TaxID=3062594 RepID=A0AAU8LY06_9BACT|nr:UPF0158 family protein [Candidatus Electrothrix aestuarii]